MTQSNTKIMLFILRPSYNKERRKSRNVIIQTCHYRMSNDTHSEASFYKILNSLLWCVLNLCSLTQCKDYVRADSEQIPARAAHYTNKNEKGAEQLKAFFDFPLFTQLCRNCSSSRGWIKKVLQHQPNQAPKTGPDAAVEAKEGYKCLEADSC